MPDDKLYRPSASAFGWRSGRSVEEWLYSEPYRFDFFQAVTILERLHAGAHSPGAGADAEKEAVRFHSRVGLDFPASDVQQLTPPLKPGQPSDMTVNFLGLAGAFGPVTPPETELILERIRSKDFAMRDFLDIFNHRLVSMMYQVRRLHNIPLTTRSPEHTPPARYLYALFGLGAPALRERMGIEDRALLYYSGILAQRPRSASGLECVLSHHFQVYASIRQLIGKWHALDASEQTVIGRRGRNQRLGQSVVLGSRVWDQQSAFEVVLGPMSLERYTSFLPGHREGAKSSGAFSKLCALIRFYAGQDYDFTIRFAIRAGQRPKAILGETRLGWTTWLSTCPLAKNDTQARFQPV